jgi:hypothetical protein
MKAILLFLALAGVLAGGCTSKSTARANARAAYYAGQADAMRREEAANNPAPAPGNTVAILGPVKFPALTWTPDLTVTKALIAAEYTPAGTPSQIIVFRQHTQFSVDPTALLNGEDTALLPGDVLKLQP